MTQQEILGREDAGSNEIHLYLEGIFWKAYEYSAYRFTFGICAFSPKKKYIKAVGQEMISIGFPMDSLKKHSALFDLVSQSEKECVIVPKNCTPTKPFEEWKASIPLWDGNPAPASVETAAQQQQPQSEAEKIVDEIRRYNLANVTPMECMMRLSQLKTRINNNG